MTSFKNLFKPAREATKPDNKTTYSKSVYFGVSRKALPSRTPFKDRLQKKDQNFVPRPGISNLIKKLAFRFTPLGVKDSYNFIKSGRLLLEINLRGTNLLNLIKKFVFSRATQTWLIYIFVSSIVGYSCYLTTFSTDFLVKNYNIKFTTGSYVDPLTTQKIVQNFTQKNLLVVIPDNHFWFLNNQTLTAAAREIEPSITKVQLDGRYWPDRADLSISTEPILTTLKINSDYYLISHTGKVIGKNFGGDREKIVMVSANHKNVDSEALTKVFSEFRPDSLVQNNQLNRLYFIDQALPKLQERGLKIVRIEIKTLFERDTDVFFTTENESKIIMDSQNIPLNENLNRLDTMIQTTKLGKDIKESKISYLDLRISSRIYVCNVGSECDTNGS